jgi:hypothetical protein
MAAAIIDDRRDGHDLLPEQRSDRPSRDGSTTSADTP